MDMSKYDYGEDGEPVGEVLDEGLFRAYAWRSGQVLCEVEVSKKYGTHELVDRFLPGQNCPGCKSWR